MKVLVVLGHPTPGSFNHAIAASCLGALAEAGHEVTFHDLYAERFEPGLPSAEIPKNASLPPAIQAHCDELVSTDGIVVIHPNWWGQPPALLKGWIDRVFRPGLAYAFVEGDGGDGVPVGLLRAKTALVFNTSNTPTERERQVFGDPLETIWKACIFGLCGVSDVRRTNFACVVTSTPAQRAQWLEEATRTVLDSF